MKIWQRFLESPNCYCRPFLDFQEWTTDDIVMYSDAAKSLEKGFGAYCDNDWMAHSWSECETFFRKKDPSIDYLEMYAVTAAVITWIHRFANRRICLFCDNEGVVKIINRSGSRSKNCMVLMRLITLQEMKYNLRIRAKHIKSEKNSLADALSRGQMDRFWREAPESMNKERTLVPEEIWPPSKIWLD